jgi:hypothetical protein
METKGEVNIEEAMLFGHFRQVDFKTIGSEQKDNDWMLDELSSDEYNLAETPMLSDNRPEKKMLTAPEPKVKNMTPREALEKALSQDKVSEEQLLRFASGCYKDIPEDNKEQIRAIRVIVKSKSPTLSVRCGKGTSWGWVDIRGSKNDFGEFTEEEKEALTDLGLNYGGNFAVISPEDRKRYLRRWLGFPQEKREE